MAHGSDAPPSSASTSDSGHRSHDGDRARDALLEATVELLADRGPAGFSSREVAKAAGVNYGLIHYYFGSKGELIRQAIRRELRGWEENSPNKDSTEWTPLMVSDPPPDRAWRSLVHLALGFDRYGGELDDFPLMRHRLEVLGEHFGDRLDPTRLKAALVASTCLQIGWLAVSDWHLASVDATADERSAIEAFVVEVERSILDTALGDTALGDTGLGDTGLGDG